MGAAAVALGLKLTECRPCRQQDRLLHAAEVPPTQGRIHDLQNFSYVASRNDNRHCNVYHCNNMAVRAQPCTGSRTYAGRWRLPQLRAS